MSNKLVSLWQPWFYISLTWKLDLCGAGGWPSLSGKHSISQVHLSSPLPVTTGQSTSQKKKIHLFLFSKSENNRRHSEGPM